MAAETTGNNDNGKSVHDRVKDVIEKIRPVIQMDGGDIQLVAVDDKGLVTVKLHGACVGCPGARMTLKMGVERTLREKVPEVTEVVAV
ncbi:MAG: NifU family protein [Phycisphaerae bacterium]|nr:NifU family protein [Phycisphaerae bacterium]